MQSGPRMDPPSREAMEAKLRREIRTADGREWTQIKSDAKVMGGVVEWT
jgi:hypothetical protein